MCVFVWGVSHVRSYFTSVQENESIFLTSPFAGTLWYQERQRRFSSTSWKPWGWTYITVNQVAKSMHCNERGMWIINDGWHFHNLSEPLLHSISLLSPLTLFPLAVCFSSRLLDPAVDDFVLMHSIFMPSSQLCPLLMAQYPFCLCSLFMYDISFFIYTVCDTLSGRYTHKCITVARIV